MAIISVAVSFGQRLLCSWQQQLQRFITVKVRKVSHSGCCCGPNINILHVLMFEHLVLGDSMDS